MAPAYYEIQTPRLLIRSCKPEEVRQWKVMESDPLNNKFGVIPTSEVNEEYLMRYLVRAADRQIIELFIIAKYENQYLPQNRPLMINGGVLVGSIQIQPRGDKTSEIGGYIHHPFTGKGYAKEAFTEVIDLAFSPINPIEAKEVVMETKRENEPFRSLMRKLGLESVQYEQEEENRQTIHYIFGKERWEQAKREIA